MFDLILFDLDGTLTNPEEGITNCVKYALESFGIKENDMRVLRRFIGPPLVDSFMKYYGMDKNDAEKALIKYRERFSVTGLYENSLIPGIPEVLKELKEHKKQIALATSKPLVYSKKILKNFKIDRYFDIFSGAELDGTRNDKAEVIEFALNEAKTMLSPVMVGDRKYDIIGAKKNGIKSIGVSFGFAEEGELSKAGADHIVDSPEELLNILISD